MVDPGTDRLVEINWSAKMPGTHNCQEDRDGNIWFSSLGESDEGFYVYNPRTEQFRSYNPVACRVSGRLQSVARSRRGDPAPAVRAGLYDAKVDSAGAAGASPIPWA